MIAYITINIDPILFHIGAFSLRWYSLIMVAATIVGAFIFAGQLRRKGIESGHVTAMLVVVVPSAIVGARLFSVLDNFGYYSHHLLAIVKPPYVSLAIYGVLTGGMALTIYCRVKKLPVLRVLDCLALAIPVGQIIGRCANIINGDTWGSPTRLPWGFVYTNPHACCRPTCSACRRTHAGLRAALAGSHGRHPLVCRATTEDRRHGHTALSRSLLVRPLLHLVLPGQQHHRARPEGGADRRPGRARGGGTGGVAAAPPGAATSSGSATRRPPALRLTPTLSCATLIPLSSDAPSFSSHTRY